MLVPVSECARQSRSAGSTMRLSHANIEGAEPGATFRVQCSCGSFVVCHVTSSLPEACSHCDLRLPDGVAARIERLRPYRGISIPETAAALSVSTKTLRDWEAGRVA